MVRWCGSHVPARCVWDREAKGREYGGGGYREVGLGRREIKEQRNEVLRRAGGMQGERPL